MNKNDSGSTLLLALWALLVLSATVFAWVKYLDQEILIAGEASNALEARALAYSGLQIALHPLVSKETPLLKRKFGPQREYGVQLMGEGGKLNLNWLLAGEDQNKLIILKNYLARRGLSFHEQQVLVDSLLDWIDPDNVKHLNGVEDEPNYFPPNRPLLSVDEVEDVRGARKLAEKTDWKKDFTIYSQGPVDLQSASIEVLSVLPGIGEARGRRFVELRRGLDKLDGTADDRTFKDMIEVRTYLGLNAVQFQQIEAFVTLKDPTYHIVSTGRFGNVNRQLEVVARKLGDNPLILLWNEF
jgi:general secretion pathway protein K